MATGTKALPVAFDSRTNGEGASNGRDSSRRLLLAPLRGPPQPHPWQRRMQGPAAARGLGRIEVRGDFPVEGRASPRRGSGRALAEGGAGMAGGQAGAAAALQLLAQRAGAVVALVDSAALQLRHDQVDEVSEALGRHRIGEVEAV